MQDLQTRVGQALAGDPAAIDELVGRLAPIAQSQVNAGMIRRALVGQAGRHDVVDLVRDLVCTLMDPQVSPLLAWRPDTALEAYVDHVAYAQASTILNQAVAVSSEVIPPPREAYDWWQAVLAGRPDLLPLAPELHDHAQHVLRPLEDHERHAVAAEITRRLPAAPSGGAPAGTPAPPSPSSGIEPPSSPPTAGAPAPAKRSPSSWIEPPSPQRRRGLWAALVLALVTAIGVGVVISTTKPDDDLVPRFVLEARRGPNRAPPTYVMGDRLQVILRPTGEIQWSARPRLDDPLELAVDVLITDGEVGVRRWKAELTRSTNGEFVLTGVVGSDIPVTPGSWELVFLVGPSDDLASLSNDEATGATAPPLPVRRLRYRIEVAAAKVRTSTPTEVPEP